MLRKSTENKYESPFSGPHKILKVNTNGTVRLCVGSVTDTVNILCIEPCKEVSSSIHGGKCNMRLSNIREAILGSKLFIGGYIFVSSPH
jgi:hypothetical protein